MINIQQKHLFSGCFCDFTRRDFRSKNLKPYYPFYKINNLFNKKYKIRKFVHKSNSKKF